MNCEHYMFLSMSIERQPTDSVSATVRYFSEYMFHWTTRIDHANGSSAFQATDCGRSSESYAGAVRDRLLRKDVLSQLSPDARAQSSEPPELEGRELTEEPRDGTREEEPREGKREEELVEGKREEELLEEVLANEFWMFCSWVLKKPPSGLALLNALKPPVDPWEQKCG